jgi:hypothetical protein
MHTMVNQRIDTKNAQIIAHNDVQKI